MSKITNDALLNLVWHRMVYSCTHMATVGVKELSVYKTLTDKRQRQTTNRTTL